jgi:hypothetical protein
MLKPFKIKSEKNSDFHNIRFENLNIDEEIIKFLSRFHARMQFFKFTSRLGIRVLMAKKIFVEDHQTGLI